MKQLFGRYVSTQVAKRVLQSNGNELGGQKKRVTILFADIRNFTTMSEQMAPEQVVDFLNAYFSKWWRRSSRKAVISTSSSATESWPCFGAMDDLDEPRRRGSHRPAHDAKLAKLNGKRAIAGKDPIHIGIGIHTDEVIVGNIGTRASELHRDRRRREHLAESNPPTKNWARRCSSPRARWKSSANISTAAPCPRRS